MSTQEKRPRTLIPTLLRAVEPQARLLFVEGEAFVLTGKASRHISKLCFEALLERAWITHPRLVGPDLAECVVTPQGQAIAAAVAAQQKRYHQLELFIA